MTTVKNFTNALNKLDASKTVREIRADLFKVLRQDEQLICRVTVRDLRSHLFTVTTQETTISELIAFVQSVSKSGNLTSKHLDI